MKIPQTPRPSSEPQNPVEKFIIEYFINQLKDNTNIFDEILLSLSNQSAGNKISWFLDVNTLMRRQYNDTGQSVNTYFYLRNLSVSKGSILLHYST